MIQESGSPINVTKGQLNFGNNQNTQNYSPFNLYTAAASIKIGASGSMTLYQTGTILIDNLGNTGAVISNNGSVTLQGASSGNTQIAVPLQNHNNLYVNGGAWTLSQKDSNGNDLSMDAGGAIRLNDSPSITLADQYTQTGGVFDVASSYVSFTVTANAANFNGGLLEFTSPTGFGALVTTNLVFGGGTTVDMSIQGETPWKNDVIFCNNCTINGRNTMNISEHPAPDQNGVFWTLISSTNQIKGDFTTVFAPNLDEVAPTNHWEVEYK